MPAGGASQCYFNLDRKAPTAALKLSGSDQNDMCRLIAKVSACGMLALIHGSAAPALGSLIANSTGT